MSSFSYTVLCPNGRRQVVKVSPNTRMLEVLEQVCKKQGYTSSEYALKHGGGRKTLDLNVPARYANLTNNAKLELVKSSEGPRAEAPTSIALQLESGERLQHDFLPNSSLWDVLTHWDKQKDGKLILGQEGRRPICVYMRQEIGYKALRSTTLRSLGLTGGRAVIRLLYRHILDGEVDELTDCRKDDEALVNRGDVKEERRAEIGSETKIDQPMEGVEMSTPVTDTPVLLPSSSETNQQLHGVSSSSSSSPPLPPASTDYVQKRKPIPTASTVEETTFYPVVQTDFSSFKFPRETEGKTLIERRTPAEKRVVDIVCTANAIISKYQRRFHQTPCDRETLVFTPDGAQSPEVAVSHELPPNFFEVTVNDVQKMAQNLKQRVKTLDAPLMTRSQREALETAKLQQYEKATIRVQFPNRLLLQAFFSPFETVGALYEFVRQSLSDANQKFELYTAPPKRVLKDKSISIGKAGLVPASIVYFGVRDESEGGSYLSESLIKDVKTFTAAESIAAERAARHAVKISLGTETSIQGGVLRERPKAVETVSEGVRESGREDRVAPSGEKSVPKWFKIGKK
ncbi:tether containing UBX domain for GLUT4-like isoform X2 [Oscarella lobularis]|uniref:tether containing UBX domain for GLUT4-like isoform X2 n=1 Tax=Oscarella lobularis TaxID=121494 RepID=UPI0033142F09